MVAMGVEGGRDSMGDMGDLSREFEGGVADLW